MPTFAKDVQDWQGQGQEVLLIHSHLVNAQVLDALRGRKDCTVFWNLRDPRDALVSLMQLHEIGLKRGIYAMGHYVRSAADVIESQTAHILRYETVAADPKAAIATIATAIGLPVTADQIAAIDQETSLDSHRAVMTALASGTRTVLEHQTKGRTLREDPETLINDRHIQSGATGRWRTELDAAAQAEVAAQLGPWITRFGYTDPHDD